MWPRGFGSADEVVRKAPTAARVLAEMVAWVREHYPNGESGIVYCLTR